MEIEIENQSLSLWKSDFSCKVGVFGVKISTYNTFEMIYMFISKLKKTANSYQNEIAILTKNYTNFIINIKKNLEIKKE